MSSRFEDRKVANGDLVLAQDMPAALTAATLHFPDGATQVFTADGKTTYAEHGRSSHGVVSHRRRRVLVLLAP